MFNRDPQKGNSKRSCNFSVIIQWSNTLGQRIWKIPGQKTRELKLINFTNFFFDQILFFSISKMAKNQFLNWGKSLKLSKMQFHEKKILIYFFSRVFLQFQFCPKINFWSGRQFKSARNAISRGKKIDLYDFTSFFFAWTFF